MKMVVLILLLLNSGAFAGTASAAEQMTTEMHTEIAHDLEANFANTMLTVAGDTEEEESVLSAKDQKVMLKTLYIGISGPLSLAGIQLDEKMFYSKVGSLLLKGAKYGVLPAAITIGWFNRLDLVVGKTHATEMNFYLDQGVLKVSTYDIKTLNVGLVADAKVGYYVALCFGGCTGGDPNGTYVGIDADVVYGVGANVYVEVGVDTTDYYKAKKAAEHYAMSDLYDARAVYVGVGVDIGIGAGIAMGFSDYSMTSDIALMDLYKAMDRPDFGANVRAAFNRVNLFGSAPRLH